MDQAETAVMTAPPHPPARMEMAWTPDQVDLIKRTVAKGATDDELQLFMYQAKRTGLDPLSRQIHFVKRGNQGTIQTGIDGYRLLADRSGKYAGSDDYRFDEGLTEYDHIKAKRGTPTTATVTIYKLVGGQAVPFTASVRWEEYYPGKSQGFMWEKMPYLMVGKTAEALALRKAFPAEMSGIYTDSEMDQAARPSSSPTPISQPQRRSTPPPSPAPMPSRDDEQTVVDVQDVMEFIAGQEYTGKIASYVRAQAENRPHRLTVAAEMGETAVPLDLSFFSSNMPPALKDIAESDAVGIRVVVTYTETTRAGKTYRNLATLGVGGAATNREVVEI